MVQRMTVNDLDNTSPMFKLPPLWLIMSGCPDQKIDLAPSDPDGDTGEPWKLKRKNYLKKVRCRWATSTEAGGATMDRSQFPSLSLDEENCIVHYDGSKDQSSHGVKPIGLMMEDFDADGNVRSSIPVQFLGQVWTPNLTSRFVGYPPWFDEHEEHPDHVDMPVRRRRSLPAYCDAVPTFSEDTPEDGAELSPTINADGTAFISFTLKELFIQKSFQTNVTLYQTW